MAPILHLINSFSPLNQLEAAVSEEHYQNDCLD